MSNIIEEITEHADEINDLSFRFRQMVESREISQAQLRDFFESIAEMVDGSVYDGYGGRGMYGKQCWGISGKNPANILEIAGRYGLAGAQWDSLGLDYIVYWPRIRYTDDE